MRRRNKGLTFYQKKKKINRSVVREIMSYLFITGAAFVVAFVMVYCIGMRTGMVGVSMQPTVKSGQQVLVNRLRYSVLAPRSGDVVVFLPNGNTNAHYYIKRIVAVPGDTLQIKDGQVYVNGHLYSGFTYDKVEEPGIANEMLTLQQDEFFVLGDNINNSEDSRADNIGPVKRDDIVGKVWFRLSAQGENAGLME